MLQLKQHDPTLCVLIEKKNSRLKKTQAHCMLQY